MPETPHQPAVKSAPPTKPCVCCAECNHDGLPDRDLDGYVCRVCKGALIVAERHMALAEIEGCVRHPHEP